MERKLSLYEKYQIRLLKSDNIDTSCPLSEVNWIQALYQEKSEGARRLAGSALVEYITARRKEILVELSKGASTADLAGKIGINVSAYVRGFMEVFLHSPEELKKYVKVSPYTASPICGKIRLIFASPALVSTLKASRLDHDDYHPERDEIFYGLDNQHYHVLCIQPSGTISGFTYGALYDHCGGVEKPYTIIEGKTELDALEAFDAVIFHDQ